MTMVDKDALLEEYKSLREEIMKRQDQRLLILAFTVTGVGSALGLTLGKDAGGNKPLDYAAVALIGFVLVAIIAATILTIQMTRQIDVISSYIIKFIEPNFPGVLWESHWRLYRKGKRGRFSFVGVPLGASKPLAVYYCFLTMATFSLVFPTGIYQTVYVLGPLSILGVFSLFCSLDLYFRKTRGWETGWKIID